MSVYLDASVIVPLFLEDAFSERADALVASERALLVADWAVVEVSGVIAKQARIGAISPVSAQIACANFDSWRAKLAACETTGADMAAAAQFVRRADLALRGPHALHIAICARLGTKLLTFDARLAAGAAALGVETGR
jgi:uncharacterized protein